MQTRDLFHRILTILVTISTLLVPAGSTVNAQDSQPVYLPIVTNSSPSSAPSDSPGLENALSNAPILFVENVGQTDRQVRFQVQGGGGALWLTEDALWLTVLEPQSAPPEASPATQTLPTPTPTPAIQTSQSEQPRRAAQIKLSFIDANRKAEVEPFDPLDTTVSYFLGNDPARWRAQVPVWGCVLYRNLYPGVDLELGGATEGWTLVTNEPGALERVRLRIDGIQTLAVDDTGRLRLKTEIGDILGPTITAGVAAAGLHSLRTIVEGNIVRFSPSPSTVQPDTIPVEAASTNDNPGELVYSTFLGGGNFDAANAIAAGRDGTVYVTGVTDSTNFPATTGVVDMDFNGGRDIFVTKLQSSGNAPVYSTFIGGMSDDGAYAITVDAAGAAYVTGYSNSDNFPTTAGAYNTTLNGGYDVVIVKLNANGAALLYSTYLGGGSTEIADGLAVDGAGAAYIAGFTASADFPTTAGAFDTTWNGGSPYSDPFVTKLNSSGSNLEYSTFLGGTAEDDANAVAVDRSGNVYVTGWTSSDDFPTTAGAFDTTFAGAHDVFITKLDASGSNLVYSGLLGGAGDDQGQSITVDAAGAVYVTGQTPSDDFPVTPGAYDAQLGGFWDGFVTKVSPNGDTLVYGTYLGGSDNDCETSGIDRECVITVDGFGIAYVAGRTQSADFPTTADGFDTSYNSNEDGFMARLSPDGKSLVYGSYFGGSNSDQTLTVAVDNQGSAYIAGRTYSPNFPTSNGAYDTSHNSDADAFVIKLLVGESNFRVVPSSVPADGVTTATVTLYGAAPGHRVRFTSNRGNVDSFGSATGTVDSLGRYATTIRSSTPGTVELKAQNLTTGQYFNTTTRVTFADGGTEPPNNDSIVITDIRSQYPFNGRYVEGVAAPNYVVVFVDWKGTAPQRVDFVLNSATYSEPADANGANHRFDMGADLRPGWNHLRITAYNTTGQASLSKNFRMYLLAKPIWMAALEAAGALAKLVLDAPVSVGREYRANFNVPKKPFSWDAPVGPPGSKFELGFFFGGSARLGLECEEPFIFKGEAGTQPKLDMMGVEFGGELKGSGQITVGAMQCEIPTGEGVLRIDFVLYGQKNWPVVTFIVDYFAPGIGTAFEEAARGAGAYEWLASILGELYLQGRLSGFGEARFHILTTQPYLKLKDVRLGGGPGFEAGYRHRIEAIEYEFRVFFSVDGIVAAANPDPFSDLSNFNFDEVVITGQMGWKFKPPLLNCGYGKTYQVEWAYPPSEFKGTLIDEETCGLNPFTRSSSNRYAVFQAGTALPQAFVLGRSKPPVAVLSVHNTITTVLVSNVYTYTEPSLDVNPHSDHAILTWVHDDLSKSAGQSHEIYFSHWDGASWSTPREITNDNLLDGIPQVAWTNANTAVAVWARLNDTLSITATWNVTTAQKIEIATAVYNATTNTWSSASLLTTNTTLDLTPRLAHNRNGQLLAVWRQNGAGLLGGDAANPDRIMAAFYNGAWNIPSVAVDNIPGLLDLAVGYGNGSATIAYTRFLASTGSITPTTQIFLSTWNGVTWSAPTQLTDDALGHSDPQIVYNSANQPLLVWRAGGQLRLRNLAASSAVSLELPVDIGSIDEFRVVRDTTGNIAAVFTAQAAQRDLYVALYDQAHNLWGRPVHLTNDRASEGYPTPALDSTGRLLMAYASTAINSVTHTATVPETGETVNFAVPTEGQTDLLTLSHEFVRNLTVSDNNFTVSNVSPAPSDTVTLRATITNSGDLALDNVAVAFYDGNPSAGGALIGTSSLPAPLAAGFTATLALDYVVPTTGGLRQLYAVADPSNVINESDETDNQATLAAFGPDLELVGVGVNPWGGSDVDLVSLIANLGTTTSPTTTIAFYRDSITGTLVLTDVVPAIAAGAQFTVTTPWNYGSLAQGRDVLAALVNPPGASAFAEVNMSNNHAATTLEVGPDLLVNPYDLQTTPLTAPTALVTVTVYNVGTISVQNANVAFYKRGDLNPLDLVLSQNVFSLAPGGAAVLGGQVAGPLGCGLYVMADPALVITEVSEANNIAYAPAEGGRCANFYNRPLSAIAPATVVFTDTSTGNNTAWLWNFGDGATSTEPNPAHQYTARGAYTVTLTVNGPDGVNTYALPNAVGIYQQAQAAFMANPVGGNAPLQVAFTDQSTGDISSWSWDFGDGASSLVQHPVHVYETAGTYAVTLTVTGLGGASTHTRSGYITVTEPRVTPIPTDTPTATPTPVSTATPTSTPTNTLTPTPTVTPGHSIYLPSIHRR